MHSKITKSGFFLSVVHFIDRNNSRQNACLQSTPIIEIHPHKGTKVVNGFQQRVNPIHVYNM